MEKDIQSYCYLAQILLLTSKYEKNKQLSYGRGTARRACQQKFCNLQNIPFKNKKHLKNVGPIRHCESQHAALPFTRCRCCRTPPAHRCPQQQRRRRRQQRQRVKEGTAMAPQNGPNQSLGPIVWHYLQTDGQTHDDSIYRAQHSCRAVKTGKMFIPIVCLQVKVFQFVQFAQAQQCAGMISD